MDDDYLPKRFKEIPEWVQNEFQENFLPGEKKDLITRDSKSKVLTPNQIKKLADKIDSHIQSMSKKQADLNHANSARIVAESDLEKTKISFRAEKKQLEAMLRIVVELISKSTINPLILDKIHQIILDSTLSDSKIVEEKWSVWEPILPSISNDIGSIIHRGNSLISHKSTDVEFRRNKLKSKDIIIGWNNHSKSFDTARVFLNDGITSIALCDGTSEGGISSQIISRTFSSLISEKFALSIGALGTLFSNNILRKFVINQCFSKSDKKSIPFCSRLTRQWPIEWVRNMQFEKFENGKTTVVNLIVLDNGFGWYRYVGDSYLFITSNGKLKQLTSNRPELSISQSTEALGLHSNASQFDGGSFYLKEGDMLIACSDLVGDKILSNDINMHEINDLFDENENNHNLQINRLEALFSKTGESDDLSLTAYKYHGCGFKPLVVNFNIGTISGIKVILDNRDYDCVIENYYFQSSMNNPKGFKKISKKVAAILSQFIDCHQKNYPSFLPNFEIVRNSTNHYVVMDHLSLPKYQRLDEMIKSLKEPSKALVLIEIMQQLRCEMERFSISHSDISPANVFIDLELKSAKIIDLNTLSWSVVIPNDDEFGIVGMYGDEPQNSNIESLYSHRLPFRIIELTLYLISTIPFTNFDALKAIENSEGEVYILQPNEIKDCFKGNKDSIQKISQRLLVEFPIADAKTIQSYLESLHILQIYELE